MIPGFADLYLHDAVLKGLELDWNARTLIVKLSVFYSPGEHAVPSLLTFSGVRYVGIPREDPWGPSTYVNSNSFTPPDHYRIEVQSGDVIEVRAESFSLVKRQDVG